MMARPPATDGPPGIRVRTAPAPFPDWLVTELAAVDTELGVLKTGKEADVHLVQRAVPGTSRSCLQGGKRYRTAEHRMFHRDASYVEGRRVRRSRETRAMARRTAFGRDLLAGQWVAAEFIALSRLWRLGAPVPYPVQLHGTELLLEYLDKADGQAAPRLTQSRPGPAQLRALWNQLVRPRASDTGHRAVTAWRLRFASRQSVVPPRQCRRPRRPFRPRLTRVACRPWPGRQLRPAGLRR